MRYREFIGEVRGRMELMRGWGKCGWMRGRKSRKRVVGWMLGGSMERGRG